MSNPSNDTSKGILASPSKRHPASMIRSSLVWEYVDRSSIMVENARKGVPVLKVAKALREQPHVRKSTQLNLIHSPTPMHSSSLPSIPYNQHHPNQPNSNNNDGQYPNDEEEMEGIYESGSVVSIPFSEDTQYDRNGASSSGTVNRHPSPFTLPSPSTKPTHSSPTTPIWTAALRERLHIQERQQQQQQQQQRLQQQKDNTKTSSLLSSPPRVNKSPYTPAASSPLSSSSTLSPYKQYHSTGEPPPQSTILHSDPAIHNNSSTNTFPVPYLKNPALYHHPVIQNGTVVTGGSKTLLSSAAVVGSSSSMVDGRVTSSLSSVSSVSSSTFIPTHIPLRRVPIHTFFQDNKNNTTMNNSVTHTLENQTHPSSSSADDKLHTALATMHAGHSISKKHRNLHKPKLQLQFNPTANAPVYYGSTVALETLDGWYLTMHPKTGIVSVREPEPGWYERGVMPFNRMYLGNGKAKEVPHYLFRLVNLQQPLANGPIRAGDPVWLVAIDGRGEEGWQTGSILIPQLHRVIELDNTVVNLLGQPVPSEHPSSIRSNDTHSTNGEGYPIPTKNNKPKGADNIMFGLPTGVPIDNKSIMDRSIKPINSSTPSSNTNASTNSALSTINPEYTALSSTLQRVMGGGLVHLEPVERKSLSKFITKDAIRTEGKDKNTTNNNKSNADTTPNSDSPNSNANVSGTIHNNASTNVTSSNADDDDTADTIVPKRKEKSLEDFLQSLRNQAAERGFVQPLDRVGSRLGFLRPLKAHVPIFGSKEDYLYGPATELNSSGIYYRRDAGYEVLYEMVNTRTIVVGKWKLQIAHKEITEDGVLIGGLGIEPTSGRALLKGIGQSTDYAPKLRKSHNHTQKDKRTMVPNKKGKNNFIDIHETSDTTKGAGNGFLSMDTLLDGDEDDDVRKKRLANVRPSEQTGPRNILVNMGLICLEQDWFYVNHAIGTPAVRGVNNDATETVNGTIVNTDRPSTSTTDDEGEEDGGDTIATEGAAKDVQLPSANDTSINTNNLPEDSIVFGRNGENDGITGGNRREVFLYPHAAGVNGPFKVERRGVFRIRMLQTGDKGTALVTNNQSNDAIALRARAQLRRTEQQRLGQAVGKPVQMDEEGNMREPRADKQDPTAAVNLSRHSRQFRYMANQRVNETYLSHEALKFASPESYYAARMQSINESLHQEASVLAAHAKAVFHSTALANRNRSYELNPSASIISSEALLDGDDLFMHGTLSTIPEAVNNPSVSSSSSLTATAPTTSTALRSPEFPERSKVEIAHHAHEHHYHNGICNLCLGPGGESVYNVDLCQPNQDIADQLLTEDHRKTNNTTDNKGSYCPFGNGSNKENENTKFSSVFPYQHAEEFTKVIEDTDHYLEVRELMDEATDILKQSSAMTDAIMQELATSKVYVPKNTDTATAMGLGRGPESGKFSIPEAAMVAAIGSTSGRNSPNGKMVMTTMEQVNAVTEK